VEPNRIDLRFLSEVWTGTVDRLIAEHGPDLEITQDYFWAIVDPAVGETVTPPEPTIGQLTEALAFLRGDGANDPAGDCLTAARLRWLGQILQGLAMELGARRG
jgi:hypothetical protein